MFRRFLLMLLVAICLAGQEEREGAGRPDIVLFDFESGSFAGWRAEGGEAFGPRPVEPEAELWHRLAPHQQSYRFRGWQGRFLLTNNMWLSAKHSWTRPFRMPPGRLVSDEFVVSRHYLKFLLAGMLHPSAGVRLSIDGRPVRFAHGNNSFDLRQQGWDVREFAGRKARLELILESGETERTMMRADFFHLSDLPPREDSLTAPVDPRDNRLLRPGLFRHVLDSKGAGTGAFGNANVTRGHDGKWHLFAEEHKTAGTVPDGWNRELNDTIFHATADAPEGPWTPLHPVLKKNAAFGEEYLWRPTVVFDGGVYHMFYLASGHHRAESDFEHGRTGVHLATSKDAVHWTRHGKQALFYEEPEIGGLCVVRHDNRWIMFYTAFASISPSVKYPAMTLFYRLSADLKSWSRWHVAMTTPPDGAGLAAGQIDVFELGARWFLLGRRSVSQFGRTRFLFSEIWTSNDPFRWDYTKDSQGLIDAWGSNTVIQRPGAAPILLNMNDHSRGAWIAPLQLIR